MCTSTISTPIVLLIGQLFELYSHCRFLKADLGLVVRNLDKRCGMETHVTFHQVVIQKGGHESENMVW